MDDPFNAAPFTGRVELPYAPSAVAGAVIATLCFPLLTLIAALMLMGDQANERRRSQLVLWAWASVALMALQTVLVLVLAVSAGQVVDAAELLPGG